jgi:hypothetical protein
VISDAHEGIKAAVAKVLNANGQRCRTAATSQDAVGAPLARKGPLPLRFPKIDAALAPHRVPLCLAMKSAEL